MHSTQSTINLHNIHLEFGSFYDCDMLLDIPCMAGVFERSQQPLSGVDTVLLSLQNDIQLESLIVIFGLEINSHSMDELNKAEIHSSCSHL